MWTHEESYRGRGITAFIHRERLKGLMRLFGDLDFEDGGSLADFGCSNGYIISVLRAKLIPDADYELHGFDHSQELLELADSRGIPGAEFHFVDLNDADGLDARWRGRFDIVTCFETIEHTGSFENAFENLYNACKRGGVILLSMPNEKGGPGLVKYIGRKVFQKRPYGDFFEGRSEFDYVRSLVTNKRIDTFRAPARAGWGPHLGFDWRVVRDFIEKTYVETHRLGLMVEQRSFLNFNLFFGFRKTA
ncbi:MAG: methyltransferase domain-containing protein [bacterium]